MKGGDSTMPQLLQPGVFSGSEVKNFVSAKPVKNGSTSETGFFATLQERLSRYDEDSPEKASIGRIFMGETVEDLVPEGEKEKMDLETVEEEKTVFTGVEEAAVMESGFTAGLFLSEHPPDDAGVADTSRNSSRVHGEQPLKGQTPYFFRFEQENQEYFVTGKEGFNGGKQEAAAEGVIPSEIIGVDGEPHVDGNIQTAENESDQPVAVTKSDTETMVKETPETAVDSEKVIAGGARLKEPGTEKKTGRPETAPYSTTGEKTTPSPASKTAVFAREGPEKGSYLFPETVSGQSEETAPQFINQGEPGLNLDKNAAFSSGTVIAQAKSQPAEPVEKVEAGMVETFIPAVENVSEEQEKAGPANRLLQQEQVMGQILQGARMMVKNGAARVRLQLQPPELGKLELALVIDRETVAARVTAESQTVQALIEAHLPELRSNLQESALLVDQLQVEIENGFDSRQHFASGEAPQEEASSVKETTDSSAPVYNEPGSEAGEKEWVGRINLRV